MPKNEPLDILETIPAQTLVLQQRPSRLRRVGCWVLVVIWFMILLLPLALFILAIQGEIALWHANVPEPDSHPLLQFDLISEIHYRGLRIVNTSIQTDPEDDNALCVQTNINYLLWVGSGEPATYCDCYAREDADASWQSVSTDIGVCSG